jgi:putative endopeptidase
MNKRSVLPILFMAMCACSPNSKQVAMPEKGIALSNLDTTAIPGDDFYQFSTGGWQKLNPITDEYSRYGIFEYLGKLNDDRIKELIEQIAQKESPAGTPQQKIADLYNIAMDTVKLNADGYEPIKTDLDLVTQMGPTVDGVLV